MLAGLALSYGLYKRDSDLGPYWTILIGAMLGLQTLVDRISAMFGNSNKGDEDADSEGTTTKTTSRYVDRDKGNDGSGGSLRRIRYICTSSILGQFKCQSAR